MRLKLVNIERCWAQSNAPFLHLFMFFSPLRAHLRYLKIVKVMPHICTQILDPHTAWPPTLFHEALQAGLWQLPLLSPGRGEGGRRSLLSWCPGLWASETVVIWLYCGLLLHPSTQMQSIRPGPRQIPVQLHWVLGLLGNRLLL